MKSFRPLYLLPAILLLLALPAAADLRSAPVMEGPPSAAIEGTITSLSIPFVGGGPIVTLLDGLVSFDATGATVRFSNGTAGTTADLAPGQRIVAFVEPTTAMPKAKSIIVLSQRTDVTLTGAVNTVDTTARTLTVLGFTARVTDKTVFGGPWDGAGQAGLEDVRVGDLVLVAATSDGRTLVATRVMKLAPSVAPTTRIHGIVEAIGTASWTIVLRDGTKSMVKVDAETKVVGSPKIGDEVDVLARQLSDGSLVAILIAAFVPPPTVQMERYQGVVKAVGPASWTIGPKAGDGPDRLFAVSGRTRILGDPKVGDEVGVLAEKQADGSYLALVIAKVAVTPPVAAVSFDGVVKSITLSASSTPAGATMVGTWVVDTTKVLVSRLTVVRGNPKVGDKVHVEGLKNADGTVAAALVAKIL